jgi:DNA-binding NarL/FixJ family response regulator
VTKIRVVVADDHETVRQGLKLLIDGQDDMEVIGEAGDGEAAVERAPEEDRRALARGRLDLQIRSTFPCRG